MYCKLKALAAQGVSIHLHAFLYHRKPAPELERYCSWVHYYDRHVNKTLLLHRLPYIVVSRLNDDLKKQLMKDDRPVLLEGLHTTALLADADLSGRKMAVRTHNIEHEYYRGLARYEKNVFKKYYFRQEAAKLEAWEPVLEKAHGIAAISPADTLHFRELNPATTYIPAFHPFSDITSAPGIGNFALYHGNLSVAENHQAALFLVENVFSKLSYPLVIAGNHPAKELQNAVKEHAHITLQANISTDEMEKLIHDAHIHVLPTFQDTGIKLKLLYALYSGRHCVVNTLMVRQTGLEELCYICEDDASWVDTIKRLSEQPFAGEEKQKREIILSGWNTAANAEKLIRILK